MFRQLKKNLVATHIAAMTIGHVAPAFADSADTLPDMGTSAGSTLSIGQEMQMGDYYVRQLRGSAPLINDPLLTQYINSLGMRLVSHANSVKTPFHFFLIKIYRIMLYSLFSFWNSEFQYIIRIFLGIWSCHFYNCSGRVINQQITILYTRLIPCSLHIRNPNIFNLISPIYLM